MDPTDASPKGFEALIFYPIRYKIKFLDLFMFGLLTPNPPLIPASHPCEKKDQTIKCHHVSFSSLGKLELAQLDVGLLELKVQLLRRVH